MSTEQGFIWITRTGGVRQRIPFKDAEQEVTLTCLQEDIDNAVCGDPLNCVFARMFKRAFPWLKEVRVGKTCIHIVMGIGDTLYSMRYDIKGKLAQAIDKFDRSKGLRGFKAGDTFTLHPPTPSDRRNARPGRTWNRQGGRGTQKQFTERRAAIRPRSRNIFCSVPTPA